MSTRTDVAEKAAKAAPEAPRGSWREAMWAGEARGARAREKGAQASAAKRACALSVL